MVDNLLMRDCAPLFLLGNNVRSYASDSGNLPEFLLPSESRITNIKNTKQQDHGPYAYCVAGKGSSEAIEMKSKQTGSAGRNRKGGIFSRLVVALTATLMSLIAVSAASAGSLSNTARATGNPPTGAAINSTTSTIAIPVVTKNPAYTVVKSITSQTTSNGTSSTLVDGGDVISYQYVVTNTGNVSINTVVLTDPGVFFNGTGPNALNAAPAVVSGDTVSPGILNVGETWTYTAQYTLTQANVNAAAGVTNGVSNTVSVTAKDPQAVTVNPTAGGSTLTATETIAASPSLTIAKTANTAGPLTVGQVVTYNFLVTNNGNVTITGVAIQETAFNGTGGTGAITPIGGASTLVPGASTNFTASYTVTQADIDGLQP